MKIMIVGGTFDNDVGKQSFFAARMALYLAATDEDVVCINGGNYESLAYYVKKEKFNNIDILLWMPNIDNKEDKLLPMIKQVRPQLVLIQSKRVIENNYTDFDLNKRLLASHSALGLKIEKENNDYLFSVIDPLGNVWCDRVGVDAAGKVLFERAIQIASMERMRSVSVGEREDFQLEPQFLDTVKELGKQFDHYITAINPDRYLGNASTRCCHGFPSTRVEDGIFVSKRNVDKTIISEDQFVHVALKEIGYCNHEIHYKGENKPSVDTPIQARLYELYPNVNYMVHGHCYVKDAPTTEHNVPCGFLEEVEEVIKLAPDPNASNFVINLRGHGCLIMANDIQYLSEHEFETRPFLEKQ